MDSKSAKKLEELTNDLADNILMYLPKEIPRKLRMQVGKFYYCIPAVLQQEPYSLNGNKFNHEYIEEAIQTIINENKERGSNFLSSYKLIKRIIKLKNLQ